MCSPVQGYSTVLSDKEKVYAVDENLYQAKISERKAEKWWKIEKGECVLWARWSVDHQQEIRQVVDVLFLPTNSLLLPAALRAIL